MIDILIQLITIAVNLITLVMIVDAVLSFAMPPYHPIRLSLGRVLSPLYSPLRKVIPPLGMIDITPLVAILLIQLVEKILITILSSFR